MGFTENKGGKKVFISSYDITVQSVYIDTDIDVKPAVKKLNFGQWRKHFPGDISDIIAADFNGDGYDDIAVIDYEDDIRVFKGDKNTTFKQVFKRGFTEAGTDFAPAADYNNDGKLDIALSNSSDTKHISIFFGKGNGKFKRSPKSVPINEDYDYFPPRIQYMQNFNFDGDKRMDIIAFRDKGDFMVFQNLGRGKFKVSIHETGSLMCFAMAAADFTGDNLDDCFVYHFTDGDVRFYKNNGNGTFTQTYKMDMDGAVHNLYTADLNKDGKPDYICDGYWVFSGYQSDWARAHTMLGKGDGTLIKKTNFPDDGRLTYGATFNDFNGDNKPDIAAAHYSGINVYPGRGTGKFKKPTILGDGLSFTPTGARVWKNNIASGDFNGDGKVDIVGAQFFRVNTSYNSNLMVFLNGGKSPSLNISDLLIDILQYNAATNTISLKGSINYTGNNIDLRYDRTQQSPTDSAFLEFKVNLETSGDSEIEYSAVYYATGEFLHKPGTSSGKVDFDFELQISKTLTNYPQEIILSDFSLYDYNLVKSNILLDD
jgi:hypothetical protein